MIMGFQCKVTEKLWKEERIRQKEKNSFGGLDWEKALENLTILDDSNEIELQNVSSLKYHSLNDGRYSVDVKRNSKWRIIFKWIEVEEGEIRKDVQVVRISSETH